MSEPVTILDQIKCVERELALRKAVYAKKCKADESKRPALVKEYRAMQAVLETVKAYELQQARWIGLVELSGLEMGTCNQCDQAIITLPEASAAYCQACFLELNEG